MMERLQINTLEELGDFIREHPEDYAFLSGIMDDAGKKRKYTPKPDSISVDEVNKLIAEGK